ncbi:MAG: hypothetical protein ACRCYE_11555 [Sarcina sp.]
MRKLEIKKIKDKIKSIIDSDVLLKEKVLDETIIKNKRLYNSYFDKTVDQYLWLQIKMKILKFITVGFAYPWILCIEQKAKCKNMVICGKRLRFIGKPKDLIGHWIIWWVLSLLTLGIYGVVVKVRFQQWVTANTIFTDVEIKTEENETELKE